MSPQSGGRNSVLGRASLLGLAGWDDVSEAVMEAGAEQQLGACAGLRDALMATGDAYLAEANPYDSTWGIGLSVAAAARTPRAAWGRNKHGEILMRRRAALEQPGLASAVGSVARAPLQAPDVAAARFYLAGVQVSGAYALLICAGADRDWHMARRMQMADATYDGSMLGIVVDKKREAVHGNILLAGTMAALRTVAQYDAQLLVMHGAVACQRFSAALLHDFAGAPRPTRLLSGPRDGSGEADAQANAMVRLMLELVELGLGRERRGLRQVGTLWEGPPPRSCLSAHSPRAIEGREDHCAVDDWRPFEAAAAAAAARGLYRFMESDACAAGLVNEAGEPIMKTTRWHLWGAPVMAAGSEPSGLLAMQCVCGHRHGRLLAARMPAAGQSFATSQTEVYTPVQSCLVAELLLRAAGFAPTSLVADARRFQEQRQAVRRGATAAAAGGAAHGHAPT